MDVVNSVKKKQKKTDQLRVLPVSTWHITSQRTNAFWSFVLEVMIGRNIEEPGMKVGGNATNKHSDRRTKIELKSTKI